MGVNTNYDPSSSGNISDDYLSNVQFNKDVTDDEGVNSDGSIKGSGQIDQQSITKDTLGISDHTGVDGAKGNKGGNADPTVPSLPDAKTSGADSSLDSFWTGAACIALAVLIVAVMQQITDLTKQGNAVDTTFGNKQNIASRDSANLAKEHMDDAADEKRSGGDAALGLAIVGAAVQVLIAAKQAKNLAQTQANSKGGQDVFDPKTKQPVMDPATGKQAVTQGDPHAWDVGRMKSDQLTTQGQIASGLQSGVSQMVSAQYDAASMEAQAQSQLTQDAQQAYAKGADAAEQDKKEGEDGLTKIIDALADAFRKMQEAKASIVGAR